MALFSNIDVSVVIVLVGSIELGRDDDWLEIASSFNADVVVFIVIVLLLLADGDDTAADGVVVSFSSQQTSGRPEYIVTLLADLVLTLSRLPVIETVVLRGAGISEACESTSRSRDWYGAMYERSSILELSLLPVILGWWS